MSAHWQVRSHPQGQPGPPAQLRPVTQPAEARLGQCCGSQTRSWDSLLACSAFPNAQAVEQFQSKM